MRESKFKASQKTLALFTEALGAERVMVDDVGLRLRFNLNDPQQHEQFQYFGTLVNDTKLKFSKTWGNDTSEELPFDYFAQMQKQNTDGIIAPPG